MLWEKGRRQAHCSYRSRGMCTLLPSRDPHSGDELAPAWPGKSKVVAGGWGLPVNGRMPLLAPPSTLRHSLSSPRDVWRRSGPTTYLRASWCSSWPARRDGEHASWRAARRNASCGRGGKSSVSISWRRHPCKLARKCSLPSPEGRPRNAHRI